MFFVFSRFVYATLIISCLTRTAFANGDHGYDSIFLLKGYQRSATLEVIYRGLKYPSAEFEAMRKLVAAKGSDADKLQFRYREGVCRLNAPRPERYAREKELTRLTLAEANSLGDHFLQALFYYYISEDAKDAGLPNISFENKLYCLDELKKDKSGKFFEQSWWLHDIASEYFRFKDFPRAAALARQAYEVNGKFQPGGLPWFLMITSNLAGVAYLKNNQFDSALVWIAKTYNTAIADKSREWTGISLGNLGNISYAQKRYDDAIPYYQRAIPFCVATGLWDNVAPFTIAMADCYIQTGNFKPVRRFLNTAKDAIEKQYNNNQEINYNTNNINYYATIIEYLNKTGSAPLANPYNDSVLKYRTKEEENYSHDKKILSEVQLAYRNTTLENQVAMQKLHQARWLLYGLIAVFVLLAVISVLLVKRKHLRQKFKEEQLEHDRLMAEEKLQLAITEIKDFAHLVQEKNELIDRFTEQIELLKQQSTEIPNDRLLQLEQIKQSVILTDDDWSRFRHSFEKVHPGYLLRLKEKFPDLTQAETRYFLLTKLDLSAKEMTAMLGVTPEALRHIRFRLRRKLQHAGDDIHSLILSI